MKLFSIHFFPIWAVLLSIVAYANPVYFVDLKSFIIPLLMLIMFSIGLTLSLDSFKKALQYKQVIAIGMLLQFSIMPLSAFLISWAFNFSTALTLGMMLVGASAGGTASNVMTYLAKGDVSLSISMTIASTFMAIIMLPLLIQFYLGESINIPAQAMLFSLVKIVLLPILFGMLLNHFLKNSIQKIEKLLPIIAMWSIILIIAIVVGLNQQNIQNMGWLILLAVILHNLIGLLSGYLVAKKLGYNHTVCKTLAIEVGMQNSGLSVALAMQYFSASAALPGALFSIWHNLSGSILASIWQKKD